MLRYPLVAALALLFSSAVAEAQSFPFAGQPAGYQQITQDATTPTALTVPTGAKFALITVETQTVRYRDDGVAPTSSVGLLLPTAAIPFVYGSPAGLAAFKVIATTSTAKVNVAYYK